MNIQILGKNAIYFLLNEDVANSLLSIFNKKSGTIFSDHVKVKEVIFQEADEECIIINNNNNKMYLCLDTETFEYGSWIIEHYLSNLELKTSEFCELEVFDEKKNIRKTGTNPKNKRVIRVYFKSKIAR